MMSIRVQLLLAGVCTLVMACGGVTVLGSGAGGGTSVGDTGSSTAPAGGGTAEGSGVGGSGPGDISAAGTGVVGTPTAGGGAGIGVGVSVPSSDAGASIAEVPECVASILRSSCATIGCHKGNASAAGPNLASPGLLGRLVDQPATFADFVGAVSADCPIGVKLIDTTNRAASWMLIKVLSTQGKCGDTMPDDGTSIGLIGDERTCFQNWIYTVPASAK